jgi:hypothetical protein
MPSFGDGRLLQRYVHLASPQRLRRVNEQQSYVTKLRQIPNNFISNIVGGLVEAAESVSQTPAVESYAVK